MSSLKTQLDLAIKTAMRAKEREKTTTLRMLLNSLQTAEKEQQSPLSGEQGLTVVTKMIKQRQDAQQQFAAAERPELAEREAREIQWLHEFLPTQLTQTELEQAVQQAVSDTQATSMRDMGKVMAQLKPQIQGRADPTVASALVKAQLNA